MADTDSHDTARDGGDDDDAVAVAAPPESGDNSSLDAAGKQDAGDVIELSLEDQKDITGSSDEGASQDAGDSLNDAAGQADPAAPSRDGDAGADAAEEPQTATAKRKRTFPDGVGGPIVVDASDHVAGRLSSFVAKLLLQGKRVSLVNCERIMISGTRSNTIHEYRQFLKINSIINPKHGPVHYRRPDTVITKMIRGMLPFEKKPSGKTAHKRLRAYVGSPGELKPFKKIQFEKAKIRRPASTYTTMGEMCRVIGWTE